MVRKINFRVLERIYGRVFSLAQNRFSEIVSFSDHAALIFLKIRSAGQIA